MSSDTQPENLSASSQSENNDESKMSALETENSSLVVIADMLPQLKQEDTMAWKELEWEELERDKKKGKAKNFSVLGLVVVVFCVFFVSFVKILLNTLD